MAKNDKLEFRVSESTKSNLKKEADRLGVSMSRLARDCVEKKYGTLDPIEQRRELIRQYKKESDQLEREILDLMRKQEDEDTTRRQIIQDHFDRFSRKRFEAVANGRRVNILQYIKEHMSDGYYDLGKTGLMAEEIFEIENQMFQGAV